MYKISIDEVFSKLDTSRHGLSQAEVDRRIEKYGKNELKKSKKQSFLVKFFKQFLNVMVMILLLAAGVSISMAIINKEYADLFEGFVILFIVVMNALIGVIQENKAEACLQDLQKYNKVMVRVKRAGIIKLVDSAELVVGDIIEVEAGNVVMADVRLIDTNNFSCDESSLTGESEPVQKDAYAKLKEVVLNERKNMAYSGSMVTSGKAEGVVVATANDTELGKIAKFIFSAKKEQTPLQKSINKIGKIITWSVIAICIFILIIEIIAGNDISHAIMTSVSLAVAAIPESLPAVITIILALGVQQLAKRKSIIKNLHAVETLGSCQIICSDKTGTLTMNKLQVVQVYSNVCERNANQELLKCMSICNNSVRQKDVIIGEPTENAIFEYVENKINNSFQKIHERPFNSNRKMMTVVVNDNGLKSFTKGAPEIIIKKCKYVLINGEVVELVDDIRNKIEELNEDMANKALRVIGFAMKSIENTNSEFEDEMVFLGLIGMMDNPRPEVNEGVKKCFEAGLKPVMITGDHKKTAFAIAKDLGIATNIQQVMTGEELDRLTDVQLRDSCMSYTVFARVTPEHKVRIVQAYKNANKIVAMTGDGVNDAPSLKIADIGVGMGKTGTDVVKNVADLVITDDNFASIVVAVEEGRKVYNNIQKTLQFLISTNCVEVFGMLIALFFFPQFTFLLPTQMLFINLVTDSLPAFALGMEKVEKDIMRNPPRNPKAGLFAGKTGISIIYQAVMQTIIVISVYVIGINLYGADVASTMTFFTIIYMQLLHSINCKTNGSIFESNIFENKTFNICFVITLSINLIVSCVPFMYHVFNLTQLNLSQWITVLVASILIIPTCELFKAILIKEKNYKKQLKTIQELQKVK